jgi:hypothetical protein
VPLRAFSPDPLACSTAWPQGLPLWPATPEPRFMLKGAPGCSEQICGAPYAEGWQTSVGSCGSSPALPSQSTLRPGEPLFERSSHRGGGAPVAQVLQMAAQRKAADRRWLVCRRAVPAPSGPPPASSPRAPAASRWPAPPSRLQPPMLQPHQGLGLAPSQSGSARHPGSPGAAPPGWLPPCQ